EAALELIETTPAFEDEALEAALRRVADEQNVKHGQMFMILRVAITGRTVSPPLTASMAALGRERTAERVRIALTRLDEMLAARRRPEPSQPQAGANDES